MKKKNSKLSGFYLGLIFVLMYLPIAVVIVFSFNESKLPVRFTGFSLKWYQELIHDDAMLEALGNSLFLGVISCFVSAVIGTLGAVGLSRIHWKTKGILEYISILPLMIPEIILGMVLMAFFYMMNLPFGMLTLLIGHTVRQDLRVWILRLKRRPEILEPDRFGLSGTSFFRLLCRQLCPDHFWHLLCPWMMS